jgi:DNA repair protein RadC
MLRAPLGIDLIREEHSARNMLREKLLHLGKELLSRLDMKSFFILYGD